MIDQQYFIGANSIDNLERILASNRLGTVMLVRGKKSYEACGAKSVIERIRSVFQLKICEFYDFEENPKIKDLQRGLKMLKEHPCKLIIAIGGGSVLDMAKLIRFFHAYQGKITDITFDKINDLLPLIAIPTTAGTGSEATHFAVVYMNNVKYSVAHPDILPDVAIIDPVFTYKNPQYLTASTGFDALAQAIEAYWSLNAIAESDAFAIRAIKLLWLNLPLAVNEPSMEVRNKVMEAAYWSGKAINIAKTTAPHAFSYPLTTFYKIPHGHAVALVFPRIAQLNLDYLFEYDIEKYNKFLLLNDKIGMFSLIDRQVEKEMQIYIEHLGLHNNLRGRVDINYITRFVDPVRLINNPCKIDVSLVHTIYEQIFFSRI